MTTPLIVDAANRTPVRFRQLKLRMQRIKKRHDVKKGLATSTISNCGESSSQHHHTHLAGVTMLRRQETKCTYPAKWREGKIGIEGFRISSERVM